MQEQIYEQYHSIIVEIVRDEMKNFLKDLNIYRAHSGTVIKKYGDINFYDVDIVTTVLKKISNKTNQEIPMGSTVTVFERYGSNYANCYIGIINNLIDENARLSDEEKTEGDETNGE